MTTETYLYYPMKKKGRRVPYEVIKVGDPDCRHKLYHYELTSADGIAYCDFICNRCGRVVSQCIGEILTPETWEV